MTPPHLLNVLVRYIIRKRLALVWRWSTLIVRLNAPPMILIGEGTRFAGLPILEPSSAGSICIGRRVSVVSRSEATALGVSRPVILRTLTPYARIEIGDDTGLSGTVVCSAASITIGKRCLIGADVTIFDTDFHAHDPEGRRYAQPNWPQISAPIVIGDDVFIGTGALIQKGVTIGSGSIIAARSVVVADVPPRSIVGGHPAKFLRHISPQAGSHD